MRKSLLLSIVVLVLSVSGFAQKTEAYIGYSHFTSGKNGWNANLGYNVVPYIQAQADLGGYYSRNNDIHSYMVGARAQATHRSTGFIPWGRFLLGGAHVGRRTSGSSNSFAWALGGGVDTAVHGKFGVRLSADAFHTNFDDNGDLHLRAGAGLFYRF